MASGTGDGKKLCQGILSWGAISLQFEIFCKEKKEKKQKKIASTDIGTIYHLLLWGIKGSPLKIVHYLFLAGFLLSYFLAEIINLGRSHCENKYCYISKYIRCSFIYSHFCPFSRRKYRFYICYLWFPHTHYFFLSGRERRGGSEGSLEKHKRKCMQYIIFLLSKLQLKQYHFLFCNGRKGFPLGNVYLHRIHIPHITCVSMCIYLRTWICI